MSLELSINANGKLIVAATPIGSLSDCSPALLQALSSADFILAEDTRRTLKILSSHKILKKQIYAYTDHASLAQHQIITKRLQQGETAVLVSDAGTPGLADPGQLLVKYLVQNNISVTPLAGPSAVCTLVSVLGCPLTAFHFWGFFPKKPGEIAKSLNLAQTIAGVHLYFDSPHRILKTLNHLQKIIPDYVMVLGRELTKIHESIWRGTVRQIFSTANSSLERGEIIFAIWRNDDKL